MLDPFLKVLVAQLHPPRPASHSKINPSLPAAAALPAQTPSEAWIPILQEECFSVTFHKRNTKLVVVGGPSKPGTWLAEQPSFDGQKEKGKEDKLLVTRTNRESD